MLLLKNRLPFVELVLSNFDFNGKILPGGVAIMKVVMLLLIFKKLGSFRKIFSERPIFGSEVV